MTRLSGSPSLLRAINDRAVLGHLIERGPLTRGALVRLTSLSKPTASQALSRLETAGMVAPAGETSGHPGRNAVIYAVNSEIVLAAAVDVRPRSLTAAVCDVHGRVLGETRRSTPARADPVETVATTVEAACAEAGITVGRLDLIQVAVPGSYDPSTDTFRYATHVPGWSKPGLVGALRQRFGEDTLVVDNDVNLAATAERTRGLAGGSDGFVLLWAGAGLGLAIDLGGNRLRGSRGGAGEVGYMPVLLGGDSARRHSEFQALAGAPAIRELARQHGIRARTAERAVRRAATGSGQAGPDAGDAFLRELAERMAVGLASVVAVLDPPLVVLAGEVCRAGGQRLRDEVKRALPRTSRFDIPVEVTGVSGNPVLLGALDTAVASACHALVGPPTEDIRSPADGGGPAVDASFSDGTWQVVGELHTGARAEGDSETTRVEGTR